MPPVTRLAPLLALLSLSACSAASPSPYQTTASGLSCYRPSASTASTPGATASAAPTDDEIYCTEQHCTVITDCSDITSSDLAKDLPICVTVSDFAGHNPYACPVGCCY